MKPIPPLAVLGLVGTVAIGLITGPTSAIAAAPAPTRDDRLSGAFAAQSNPVDSAPFFSVGAPGGSSSPVSVGAHETLHAAVAHAAEWSFPSLGASGPVSTQDARGERCLQPHPSEPYKYLYAERCDESAAQQWVWAEVANDRASGWGLVSAATGGFLRQFDGRLAVGGAGVASEAALVLPGGLAPRPAMTTVTLIEPAPGVVVRDPRPTFRGEGQAGSAIEVLDAGGDLLGQGVVDDEYAWSVQLSEPLSVGRHSGVVRQVVDGSTVEWSATYAAVQAVSVDTPALDGAVDVPRPVFSGLGEPGARVTVVEARDGMTLVDTVVDATGAWQQQSLRTLAKRSYTATATQLFQGATTSAELRFTYGAPAPQPDPNRPLVVTSPTVGQVVNTVVPVFTGTATPGARIEIWGAWKTLLGSAERVDASGAWSITWNKSVLPGRYSGGVVRQLVDGVEVGSSFVYDFRVAQSLVVQSPTRGGALTGTRPVFTGTATPGATVSITGAWGTDLGRGVAEPDGRWMITWPKDYAPGRYSGGQVQQRHGGVYIDSVTYDFTLTR